MIICRESHCNAGRFIIMQRERERGPDKLECGFSHLKKHSSNSICNQMIPNSESFEFGITFGIIPKQISFARDVGWSDSDRSDDSSHRLLPALTGFHWLSSESRIRWSNRLIKFESRRPRQVISPIKSNVWTIRTPVHSFGIQPAPRLAFHWKFSRTAYLFARWYLVDSSIVH